MTSAAVIPCWNREETIRDTIEGIVNQEYPNFELIISVGGAV